MSEKIYWSPEAAKEELLRRRQDLALQAKITSFLGSIPENIPKEPFVAKTPYIASPNR